MSAYDIFSSIEHLHRHCYSENMLNAVKENDIKYVVNNMFSLIGMLKEQLLTPYFFWSNRQDLSSEKLIKMVHRAGEQSMLIDYDPSFDQNECPRLLIGNHQIHNMLELIRDQMYCEYRFRETKDFDYIDHIIKYYKENPPELKQLSLL